MVKDERERTNTTLGLRREHKIIPESEQRMGSEAWADPRTHIAVVGGCVGIAGFLWGILSFHWNRRESRLDALSKVLQPLIRTAQLLREANDTRRKCEVLKVSFPATGAKEAVSRVTEMVELYGKLISDGSEQFKLAESENEARCFRFPDKIARLVQTALKSLSEMGCQVNDGKFEQVEVQFAKFSDDYVAIKRAGRGLRLAVPLEGLWKVFSKKEATQNVGKYELTKKEMAGVLDLIHRRATTQAQNTFAIHPPKKTPRSPGSIEI